jgi:hypothetical protein
LQRTWSSTYLRSRHAGLRQYSHPASTWYWKSRLTWVAQCQIVHMSIEKQSLQPPWRTLCDSIIFHMDFNDFRSDIPKAPLFHGSKLCTWLICFLTYLIFQPRSCIALFPLIINLMFSHTSFYVFNGSRCFVPFVTKSIHKVI